MGYTVEPSTYRQGGKGAEESSFESQGVTEEKASMHQSTSVMETKGRRDGKGDRSENITTGRSLVNERGQCQASLSVRR